VSVHAPGFRSCFGMARALSGVLYATDNGANSGFGARSLSCTTQGDDPNVQDSLYIVRKGSYYGHANRNRGRVDQRQCVWRGEGSTPAIAQMTSSTNGIVSYTGNAFGGQLKNNLFLTKMAWMGQPGKTFRVELADDGQTVKAGPYEIWGDSGLSVVQGPGGELFMPQLKSRRVLVLVPDEGGGAGGAGGGVAVRAAAGPLVHAVHPTRGHVGGGTDILVSGARFAAGATVRVGGALCLDVRVVSAGQLRCRTPAGGGAAPVTVTVGGLTSETYGADFAYAG
jgi:hypothetical protein